LKKPLVSGCFTQTWPLHGSTFRGGVGGGGGGMIQNLRGAKIVDTIFNAQFVSKKIKNNNNNYQYFKNYFLVD
jgi:hypothetical protein